MPRYLVLNNYRILGDPLGQGHNAGSPGGARRGQLS